MTKRTVICDAEFDSLTPTKLWVVACKDVTTEEVFVFRFDEDYRWKNLKAFIEEVDVWIGHNFLNFDAPNLNRLLNTSIPTTYPEIIDTLVISRLINFTRAGGHSIENLGKQFGLKKETIIEYDKPELIEEYTKRCISDVEINHKIYTNMFKRFVEDEEWHEAIQLEHDFSQICQEITNNGFGFSIDLVDNIHSGLTTRITALEQEIKDSIGPIRELDKQVTLRKRKDGTPDKRTEAFIQENNIAFFKHGDVIDVYKEREFNPASPRDRINLLNESGWKPTVKTKTHQQAEREYRRKRNLTPKERERWDRLKETGWQVCEENLETLPENAPVGAKKLAEWLCLNARLSDLEEWKGHYNPTTGAIHSNIQSIGSWTHRCSHTRPNCANIFSVFKGEVKTEIDRIKDRYDGLLRSLWSAREGKWLVGCDAEGIQLRVLAHLMEDEEYIEAVSRGTQKDKTDVHNVNLRVLDVEHATRDDAKTFIYAWVLGAGTEKVASILKVNQRLAKARVDSFIARFPGLKRLKEEQIPREAARGFFVGLDGRKVVCNSEHLMLAGHLQNGERVIMARANRIWRNKLIKEGIEFKQVNIVHDEFQTEVETEEIAHYVGQVQADAIRQAGEELNLLCPMAGKYQVGRNWQDTH